MILKFDVDIATAAFDLARDATLEQVTAANIEKVLTGQAIRVGQEVVRRLPTLKAAAWSWVDQLGKGKLVVTVDTADVGIWIELACVVRFSFTKYCTPSEVAAVRSGLGVSETVAL